MNNTIKGWSLLYSQALPATFRKGHEETLQAGIFYPPLRAELLWLREETLVHQHVVCRHARWSIPRDHPPRIFELRIGTQSRAPGGNPMGQADGLVHYAVEIGQLLEAVPVAVGGTPDPCAVEFDT